jgi:hypothetical protein
MLRFTIRDVLWLTVLVAGVLAWTIDRSVQHGRLNTAEWQRDSAVFLTEQRGYNWEMTNERVVLFDVGSNPPHGARWTVNRTDEYPSVRAH